MTNKNSYPNPSDFSISELRDASKFYMEGIENNSSDTSVEGFMARFRCSQVKAGILRNAAIFNYNMKCKRLA